MLPPRPGKVGELASSRVNPAGTDAVAVADALANEDGDEAVGDADAVVVAEVVGSKDTVGIGVGSGSDVQPARASATTDVATTAWVRPAMTVRDERMVTSWPRRYRRGGRGPRRLARDRRARDQHRCGACRPAQRHTRRHEHRSAGPGAAREPEAHPRRAVRGPGPQVGGHPGQAVGVLDDAGALG